MLKSALSPALTFAGGATNSIAASLTVPNTCTPTVSNTAITFPNTAPGTFAPTANDVTVTDVGNVNSNILVSGGSGTSGNWISGLNNFYVTNTLWNGATGANIGNQLTTSAVDTKILVAFGSSNNIYFGVNVPASQAPGTYTQTIVISTSC